MQAIYRFGRFRLDAERMTLTRDGVPVVATPRVVAALLYLIEHAGELCSRDEMLSAFWPGRLADEANLSQAISAVRKAIADDAVAADWQDFFAAWRRADPDLPVLKAARYEYHDLPRVTPKSM